MPTENIVFSQEDLYSVLSGVALQNEPAVATFPSQLHEDKKSLLRKPIERQIEKPIGKGPFKCDLCPNLDPIATWGKYKRHVRSHDDDKRHRCPQCSLSFNMEKNLRLHLASHDTDNLVCPECMKSFNRIASFKSHLSVHEEEDDLSCSQCEALFATDAALNTHIEHDHMEQDSKKMVQYSIQGGTQMIEATEIDFDTEENKLEMKFTCKLCQAKLSNLKQYNVHMEHHNKLKNLLKLKQRKKRKVHPARGKYFRNVCKTCGKKFLKPSQLVRHERIHNGEKPFVVSYKIQSIYYLASKDNFDTAICFIRCSHFAH